MRPAGNENESTDEFDGWKSLIACMVFLSKLSGVANGFSAEIDNEELNRNMAAATPPTTNRLNNMT